MNTKYPHILSPLKVRGVMFQNRIFVTPTGHSPSHKHPSSWDSIYDNGLLFYDKSLGGAAAYGVDYVTNIIKDGKYEKLNRDHIRELMSMATQSGGRVGTGTHVHVKPYENPDLKPVTSDVKVTGWLPHGAPGQINWPQGTVVSNYVYRASDGVWNGLSCFEMPETMMMEIIEKIKEKAKVAMDFGFDYISWSLQEYSSFLSAKQNHRTDQYGGSIENRCRFMLMQLRAIREVVGEQVPIVCTVDYSLRDERSADLSHTPEETLEFIRLAHAEKLMDICILMTGMDTENLWDSNVYHCGTIFQKKETELEYAKLVKKTFPDLIVVPRGGWNEPEKMEEAIANGWCDGIMVGRQFVADPFWLKKVIENREEDIVPCIRCDHCYHSATDHNLLCCSVNPRLFRESRVPLKLEKAPRSKNVVIIGGGPGGCKAAITAYDRGHSVTLIEKSDSLGGALKHSPYDNHKSDLVRLMNYYRVQVEKRNIKVLYNTTATVEMVKEMQPDALVIAIGAEPIKPRIQGIENAYEATDIYTHQKDVGDKVILVGAGCVGSELALTLAENGKHVTMIDMNDEIATEGHFFYKLGLKHALLDVEDNWEMYLESKVNEIGKDYVCFTDKDGNQKKVSGDTVIYACGMRSKSEEAMSFYGIAPETAMIGDCKRVGKVLQANTEGYFFAADL